MNFIDSAKYLVHMHGVQIVYSSITTGSYNIETGTTTNTSVDTTLTAFPKTIRANSYNYPNLIGKTVLEFIIVATDIATAPKTLDTLSYASETYTVDSVRAHAAQGAVVIYKVVCFKG
jgi:hypothetical protein